MFILFLFKKKIEKTDPKNNTKPPLHGLLVTSVMVTSPFFSPKSNVLIFKKGNLQKIHKQEDLSTIKHGDWAH